MDYLLRRDSNHNGLVEIMTDSHRQQLGGDWLDVIWVSFEAASVNAQMYNALVLWADARICSAIGSMPPSTARRPRLKAGFNKTTAEGGFWNRTASGMSTGATRTARCTVTTWCCRSTSWPSPTAFATIASARRHLDQTEARCKKKSCSSGRRAFIPIKQDELGHAGNWPFPAYENGDIFLAWGEVGIRAYAEYDPAIAVRYVKNVLDQYHKDGLAFQRYLRKIAARQQATNPLQQRLSCGRAVPRHLRHPAEMEPALFGSALNPRAKRHADQVLAKRSAVHY